MLDGDTGDAPMTRTPRPKKTERKRTIKILDELWRQLIYLRDDKTCQFPGCGKTYVQAHHIFSKNGRFLTRWDVDNGICLCAGHHTFRDSAHEHPARFHEFMRKRLGAKRYDRILVRSEQSAKGQDLEAVRLDLLQQIAELEGSGT